MRKQFVTALAPMQDVTTTEFMGLIAHMGTPDLFVTEYFRVHEHSRLEKHISESITHNTSGKPIFAQIIGESIPHIRRTIGDLLQLPVAGIDLNMGCPAPKVYKKNVGGGLLREVDKIDAILGEMRATIPSHLKFTVKMRIGFEDTESFESILKLINKHQVDMLTVHGRTVKEMYRSEVRYPCIQQAVQSVQCPVLANGNITSHTKAQWAIDFTGAQGVMIGRSAIRNPWIFRQIREHQAGDPVFQPTLSDVHDYCMALYAAFSQSAIPEENQVAKLKKFMNFIGLGVDAEGRFLHDIRRAHTEADFFEVLKRHLLEHPEQAFSLEPYEGLVARPNRESAAADDSCHL